MFSQMFSTQVAFIEGKAYVGGMRVDKKDAKFVDFLLSGGAAEEAILIEIKTPCGKLLGGKYRKSVFDLHLN